jgi:hypothetical protein
MKHTCHALRCETSVPPKMFMCLKHWRMVPRLLQSEVWATYVPGQEVRKDPTDEYLEVTKRARRAVAEREGLTLTDTEERMLSYGL